MAASKPVAGQSRIAPNAQPSPQQIRSQLGRILDSNEFLRSDRLRRFLRFTVECVLSGETERIKEYTLGRDVFDRSVNFDPRVDSIVRVEARRLRRKLREYYRGEGAQDAVMTEFHSGSYVPSFRLTAFAAGESAAQEQPSPLNPRTVAVLPFRNLSPDPDQEYFCEGIAEEILNTLTTIPQLNVVARTSSFRFQGSSVDVREIGNQLHAGTVIEGSVRKADNQLRIAAQVIDTAQGVLLWSGTFDRELNDVFRVQDEIALAIAESLHVTLAVRMSGPITSNQPALEAYTLLLKGRHFWNQVSQEGVQQALREFTSAISLYPDYAPPYAALSEAYLKITFWGAVAPGIGIERSRQAALEAVRLDPRIADAHAFLGVIATTYDWHWSEGRALLQRANDLQPSNMNAISYCGLHHVFLGQFEEAWQLVNRSSELDPLSPWSFRNQAWTYYYERRYEAAYRAMSRAIELDPDFREGQFMLAYAQLRQGRFDDAIALLLALPAGPYEATKWGALGEAYASAGNIALAESALEKLDEIAQTGYVSPINHASIFAGLQDWDRMFQALERAFGEHTPWLSAILVEPRYDPIRSDARFATLLARMNLA